MIFITFDPYNDNTYNDKSIYNTQPQYDDCFVCMETIVNNQKTIKLKNQIFYLKQCQCDGNIHQECLDKWLQTNSVCPICRSNMIKNDDIIIKLVNSNNSNNYFIITYLSLKINFYRIQNSFVLSIIMYVIFEFYRYVLFTNIASSISKNQIE